MNTRHMISLVAAAALLLAGGVSSEAKKKKKKSKSKHTSAYTWTAPGAQVRWGQWGNLSGPRLGAHVQPLTDELRRFFGARAGRGVLVAKVLPGSAAAKAGLRAGDVVVSIDGQRVASVGDIWAGLRGKVSGAKVKVGIVRNKRPKTLSATIRRPRGTPLGKLSHTLKQLQALNDLNVHVNIPDIVYQLSQGKVRLGPAGRLHMPGVDVDLGAMPKAQRTKVRRQLERNQRRLKKLEQRLGKLENQRKSK